MPADPPTRAAIPWWRRPAVVASGCVIVAALAVCSRGWQADLPAAMLLAVAGVLLSVEDLTSHRLPTAILRPTVIALVLLLTAAALLTGGWPDLLRGLLAAVVCGGGYLVLALLRPTGLGLGDVKLGALLGLWLGWLGWEAVLVGVLAGFFIGGVVALVLVVLGRAGRTSAIAFGPWMILGAAAATALT